MVPWHASMTYTRNKQMIQHDSVSCIISKRSYAKSNLTKTLSLRNLLLFMFRRIAKQHEPNSQSSSLVDVTIVLLLKS